MDIIPVVPTISSPGAVKCHVANIDLLSFDIMCKHSCSEIKCQGTIPCQSQTLDMICLHVGNKGSDPKRFRDSICLHGENYVVGEQVVANDMTSKVMEMQFHY